MLRLIFTAMATLALLFAGSVWLAAQPSGSEVREVMEPVLRGGFELARTARDRAAALAEANAGGDDRSQRVTLKPTASGIWEPEAKVASDPSAPPRPPAAKPAPKPPAKAPPEPAAKPAVARSAPPPLEEEEILPWLDRPFAESEPEGPISGPDPETDTVLAGPSEAAPVEQDGWAQLIRRMLAVQARVGRTE